MPCGADRYEDDLDGRVKPKTRDGYVLTLKRARNSFGNVYLDEIGNSELRRFDNTTADDDSRLRYLRELGACLAAAVADKSVMLNDNPVPAFTKTARQVVFVVICERGCEAAVAAGA